MSTNTIAAPESMAMIENTKTMMAMMTLSAAMTDELLDRLRAVLWSVTGEPNANGNVDETVCSEAADCIEALRIDRDRIAAEWAEVSQRNYQRAKKAEAEKVDLKKQNDLLSLSVTNVFFFFKLKNVRVAF